MFFRRENKLEAIIGTQTECNGEIRTTGTLRIDGRFTGNISSDWVVIGETGSVQADINARGIVIGGTVTGTVRAEEIVEILPKGQLRGDMHTTRLTVSEGGVFEGRSFIRREAQEEVKAIGFASPHNPD